MKRKKQKGGFDLIHLETFIDKHHATVDKVELYGSSANCKVNTITLTENAKSTDYLVKYQLDPYADNLLIDDYIGRILQIIDTNHIFSKYKDSFSLQVHNNVGNTYTFPYTGGECITQHTICVSTSISPTLSPEHLCTVPVHIQEKLNDYVELSKCSHLKLDTFINQLNIFFNGYKQLGEKYNYIHNDAHLGNVMINKNTYELRFIDYGRNYFNIKSVLMNNVFDHNTIIISIIANNSGIDKVITDTDADINAIGSLYNANTSIGPDCITLSIQQHNIGYLFDISTITMYMLLTFPDVLENINAQNIVTQPDIITFTGPYININEALIKDSVLRQKLAKTQYVHLYNGIIWFYHYVVARAGAPPNLYIKKGNDIIQINVKALIDNYIIHSSFVFLHVLATTYNKMDKTKLLLTKASVPAQVTSAPAEKTKAIVIEPKNDKKTRIYSLVRNVVFTCFGYGNNMINQAPQIGPPINVLINVSINSSGDSVSSKIDAIVNFARERRRNLGSSFVIPLPGVPDQVGSGMRKRGGTIEMEFTRIQLTDHLTQMLKDTNDDDFASYVQNKTMEIMKKHHPDIESFDTDFDFLNELYLLTDSPPSIKVFEQIKRTEAYKHIEAEILSITLADALKQQPTQTFGSMYKVPTIKLHTNTTPRISTYGGGALKMYILGRYRIVQKIGRTQFITFKKTLIKLVDAKKLDAKTKKESKQNKTK